MNLILAILSIPFRLVFSVLVFLGTLIFGFISCVTYTFQYPSFHYWKNYWEVTKEAFVSACGFPFWPMVKIFRR